MSKTITKQKIEEFLSEEKQVKNSELADKLGISIDTVRRLLKELEAEGKVQVFHGGASALGTMVRSKTMANSGLEAILSLIGPNQVIILEFSQTASSLVRYLSADLHVSIITNSVRIASAFPSHSSVEVRVLGGVIRDGIIQADGNEVFEFLQMTRPALCVLNNCYLNIETGLTTNTLSGAKLRAAMITNATNVVIELPAEELDCQGGYAVGTIEKITHIFVRGRLPQNFNKKKYEKKGIKVFTD